MLWITKQLAENLSVPYVDLAQGEKALISKQDSVCFEALSALIN